MGNRKGLTSFTSFIVGIIIIIPVLLVILIVFVYGTGSIQSLVTSPTAYVSQTLVALTTGESVISGTLSPSFQSSQFMVQFYGSTECISLLDQLSRAGILSSPNNPSTLNNQYFVCTGSYNDFNFCSGSPSTCTNLNPPAAVWGDYLPSSPGQAAFPVFFTPDAGTTTMGINGSHSTLSYYEQLTEPVQTALGDACVSFLDADTAQYGPNTPSAYITSLDCVPLTGSNTNVYMSVKDNKCENNPLSDCNLSPWVFLHGSPASFALQTCTDDSSSSALICQFTIN